MPRDQPALCYTKVGGAPPTPHAHIRCLNPLPPFSIRFLNPHTHTHHPHTHTTHTYARHPPKTQTARNTEDNFSYPPNSRTYRGGGLPDEHKAFFTEGKKYRVPGFLASYYSEDKAYEFMYRAHDDGAGLPAVKWVVELDPRGAKQFKYRCEG